MQKQSGKERRAALRARDKVVVPMRPRIESPQSPEEVCQRKLREKTLAQLIHFRSSNLNHSRKAYQKILRMDEGIFKDNLKFRYQEHKRKVKLANAEIIRREGIEQHRGVAVILKSVGGLIFLAQRAETLHRFPAKWCSPGGRIEKNETPLRAVKRELLEETGIDLPFSAFKLLKTLQCEFEDGTPYEQTYFVAEKPEFVQVGNPEHEKHSDWVAYAPEAAIGLDLIPSNKIVLQTLLN